MIEVVLLKRYKTFATNLFGNVMIDFDLKIVLYHFACMHL